VLFLLQPLKSAEDWPLSRYLLACPLGGLSLRLTASSSRRADRLPQRSPRAIRSALARSTQNWVGRRCKKRAGRSYSSHFQPDTSPAWRTLMAKAALPACPHRLRCMLVICQPMGGQKPSLNRSIQVTTRRQHGRTC
jgi:hypothetical protein